MGQGRRFSWPTVFVLGVWAVLTAADLWFVAHFSRNVPYIDDWWIVPVLTGKTSALGWVFEKPAMHGGHVLIVPKLLWLACHAVSGHDFRSVSYLGVGLLSGAALMLIATVRRLRGHLVATDCLLPIVCLHWGHWANLVCNNFSSQFIISTVLALAMLAAFVLPTTKRTVATVITCTVLLPLCGVNGWTVAPAGVAWLAWQRRYVAAAVGTVLLLATAPFFSAGNVAVDHSPAALATRALAFAGTAASPAEAPAWAIIATLGILAAVLFFDGRKQAGAVAACAGGVGVMMMSMLQSDVYVWLSFIPALIVLCGLLARTRGPALVFYLGAMGLTVAAVAWGRGMGASLLPPSAAEWATQQHLYGVGRIALPDAFLRYRTLLVPFLCLAYFGFRDRPLWPAVLTGLAILCACTYVPEALLQGQRQAELKDAFLADVRGSEPVAALSAKWLHPIFMQGRQGEAAGLAPFRASLEESIRHLRSGR